MLYLCYNRAYVIVCYSLAAVAGSWGLVEFYEHVINMPDAPTWTRSVSSVAAGLGLLMAGVGLFLPSRFVIPPSSKKVLFTLNHLTLHQFSSTILLFAQ